MVRSFSTKECILATFFTFLALITLEKLFVLFSDNAIVPDKVDLKSSVIERPKPQQKIKNAESKNFKASRDEKKVSSPQLLKKEVAKQHINQYENDKLPYASKLPWKQFVNLEVKKNSDFSPAKTSPLSTEFKPVLFCSPTVEQSLSKPMLSKKDEEWCDWAISPKGAGVIVGKSWGTLVKDNDAKDRFEDLNCNAYSKGVNPSCDDEWGDPHIVNWRKMAKTEVQCQDRSTSKATCYDNENQDRFCVMENVQINFNMIRDRDRGSQTTKSKDFEKGFLSIDCGAPDTFLKWSHLFSTQIQSNKQCDYIINGTTVVYSHDDMSNVGHTLNDIMNVWTLLWLTGTTRYQDEMTLLNIDSFNLGHNLNDDVSNPFYTIYHKTFQKMIPGSGFGDKTVCLQRGVFQSQPQKMFVWDSWNKDSACSLLGPATLFQRWNLAVRHAYGLLTSSSLRALNTGVITILVVDRKATVNRWGNERTSRNILNMPDLITGIQSVVSSSWGGKTGIQVTVKTVAFEKMTFEEQIRTVSQASIIIGTHGAGLALALHMSVGTKYCCGVVEIFPQGEFFRIRGHGNMLRRTGVKYNRVDISSQDSQPNGVIVPIQTTAAMVDSMLREMIDAPACIRKDAYDNPYLDIPDKLFET